MFYRDMEVHEIFSFVSLDGTTLQWYLVDFGDGAGSKAEVWCFSKVLRIRPSDKVLPNFQALVERRI